MRIKRDELKQIIVQFIKFGIIGVSNTLINIGIYYILVFVGVHYIIANTIRICCQCFECVLLE